MNLINPFNNQIVTVGEAVSYQDEHRKNPPYYFAGTNIPSNLIGKIIRLAPEVAKIQDCDGNLPLHCACLNKRPWVITRCFLKLRLRKLI